MKSIRIGTRGSPLALAQTHEVSAALETQYAHLKGKVEIVPLKTTGDTIQDRSLLDLGGKSLFTKEIEMALLENRIDMAVHSMKDMAADSPQGLIVPSMLERADPRDALISQDNISLADLPKGAIFGTSSLRRQAFVLSQYPHLQVTSLRGNVQTRLKKLQDNEIQATLLAVAGLKRVGLLEVITEILSTDEFIPAVGQGAIGVQCRENDKDIQDLLAPLNHMPTFQTVSAERAFLKALNGSCRTPIAAYGLLNGEKLFLRGMVSDPDGQNMKIASLEGLAVNADQVGLNLASRIREIDV